MGLKARYKHEGNANDETGAYNGTASNVTYKRMLRGTSAGSFNGTSSVIKVSNPIIGSQPTAFTFAFWVNASSQSAKIAMGSANSPGGTGLIAIGSGDTSLGHAGSAVRLLILNASGTAIWGGVGGEAYGTPFNGSWNHIAATGDGTTFRLYVNGSQVGSKTAAFPGSLALANFAIGASARTTSAAFFNGLIDDARIYDTALSAAEVLAMYNAEKLNYPVAAYELNGDAVDCAGENYSGTATSLSYTTGKQGQAGSFTGATTSRVRVSSAVASLAPLTLAAWMRPASVASNSTILCITQSGGDTEWFRIYFSSVTGIRAQKNSAAGDGIITSASTAVPVVNTWYHVVGVFTANSIICYANAVATGAATSYTTAPGSLNRAAIGSLDRASPTEPFNGLIDDARIYNHALTAAEVLALYRSYSPQEDGWTVWNAWDSWRTAA